MTIDVSKELGDAKERLPIQIDSSSLPMDVQVRAIALTIAQRHRGDTVIREGAMYQQMRMENKTIEPLTDEHVIRSALFFERYLWGEYSKGLMESAINSALTQNADVIEKAFEEERKNRKKKGRDKDEPVVEATGGSQP